MPTPNKGPRMGGSPAHERLMLSNLCAQLIQHGRITTTESKAKRLRPHVEKLITFGKRGDLHSRRQVLKVVRDKSVVHTLFAEVGPRYVNRPGGYTRIVKLGPRKGDNAPMALIELVEALTVSQQAVGEAERARGTQVAPSRPVTGSTRESAQALASQSPTAAGVASTSTGDQLASDQPPGNQPAGDQPAGEQPPQQPASTDTLADSVSGGPATPADPGTVAGQGNDADEGRAQGQPARADAGQNDDAAAQPVPLTQQGQPAEPSQLGQPPAVDPASGEARTGGTATDLSDGAAPTGDKEQAPEDKQ